MPYEPTAFEALQAEHEALLAFLYLCPAGVVQSGIDGTVRMINPYAAQLLMPLVRSPAIVNLFTALEHSSPELRYMAQSFKADSGQVCQGHRIIVGGSGPGPRVLSCSLLKVSADCLVAVLQDVSREVEQERQLKQSEVLFAALVAGVNDFALFSLDVNGLISTWNMSGARQTGFHADEVLGHDLDIFSLPDDVHLGDGADQLLTVSREGWSMRETSCRRRNGERYWCQILVAAVEGETGCIESYSVVMRDVTERRMTGDELRRLLTCDHLTGATNRAHFFELAQLELGRWTRTGLPLSAIVFDVDRFKNVNDAFGHAAGDALLRALVPCCRGCLREGDILARVGGEEFAVLLPGTDLSAAVLVAESMRASVASHLAVLGGMALGATISLGCAEFSPRHHEIDALLGAADEAMYRAKRAGRNQVMAELSPAKLGSARSAIASG